MEGVHCQEECDDWDRGGYCSAGGQSHHMTDKGEELVVEDLKMVEEDREGREEVGIVGEDQVDWKRKTAPTNEDAF